MRSRVAHKAMALLWAMNWVQAKVVLVELVSSSQGCGDRDLWVLLGEDL